ncbi:transposase [Candidatus Uhrbacteria bacterium]|nr:transposase [Candidatus Uhrbacteria bacterium]
MAYGVREDLKRELLALSINPTESASEWREQWELLLKRGVQTIDLIVADGLSGLEQEVHRVFPGSTFQKCVVHKMRNILNKTRPQDKHEMAKNLKEIFENFGSEATIENALAKIEAVCDKWHDRYPHLKRFFNEETTEYYFTYIQFSPRVRRMIYTTNSIENVNRVIRKATKNKLSFESPDTLLDYVFMVIKEFEEKNFMKYPVQDFTYFKLPQTQLI